MFVSHLTRSIPVGGRLGVARTEGAMDGLSKMESDRGMRGENAMAGEAK